jgi:glucosylglycerate synthase
MGDASVEDSFLPESVRTRLEEAEQADIIIGLLTFNDTATAPTLVRTMIEGCTRSFPQQRLLVVNCDAGSQDGTAQAIEQSVGESSRLWTIHHPVLNSSYKLVSESGVPGRESAVRILATLTDKLNAAACLVVDGNVKSADEHWPELLLDPIISKGVDCVLPWFLRNRYEGTLTNTLLAPLTAALYGKRIPYHLGGAYAFSANMIRSTLLSQPWDQEIAHHGIDGWVMTLAVAESLQICRAGLGPRLQPAKPIGELSALVAQSVGCLFYLMQRYQEKWETVKDSAVVPTVGPLMGLGAATGSINVERMVNGFRQGLRDLLPVWQIILPTETFQQVLELGVEGTDGFRFPPSLWVQVIYDFALAYHDRLLHREHLLKALTPLYLGYTASLVLMTREQPVKRVEEELERLADEYETMKPYLIQRWRWSDE